MRIYLKREDLLHTGAHKINNAIGQALLAKYMGKKRVIAETGAGQHGVATATAAALLANEVQMMLGPLGVVMPHIKSGKLRALAVTGGARLPVLPAVPTMAEAGVPNYEYSDWHGLFAPAGTPREILGRFQAEIARAIAMPDVRERLTSMGYEPVASTPEEFEARYRADIAKYARIIREARIPLQD